MESSEMATGALSHRAIDDARRACAEAANAVAALAMKIAAVPAPTGWERERAELVAGLLEDHGGREVSLDHLSNVVARVPGQSHDAALLLAAHTDTVFPPGTAIAIERENARLIGPGIGDNSLGVAAVVALPNILRRLGIIPAVDLLLTGNVGEEGTGNLRGMRAVMDQHPDAAAAIAVEGHNLGRVTHVAVGSRRLRVTVTGPGGHSWGDFGRANAIQVAADIINDLSRLPVAKSPKTSLSVGTILGGVSVNTIPPTCSFELDMRSTSPSSLSRLSDRVERVLALARNGTTVSSEVIGERPAGIVPLDSPIVRTGMNILAALGISGTADASSTDANVPISRGIPAICVGLTTGGNVHRVDEFIELAPLPVGLAQLTLLTTVVAQALGNAQPDDIAGVMSERESLSVASEKRDT